MNRLGRYASTEAAHIQKRVAFFHWLLWETGPWCAVSAVRTS